MYRHPNRTVSLQDLISLFEGIRAILAAWVRLSRALRYSTAAIVESPAAASYFAAFYFAAEPVEAGIYSLKNHS